MTGQGTASPAAHEKIGWEVLLKVLRKGRNIVVIDEPAAFVYKQEYKIV